MSLTSKVPLPDTSNDVSETELGVRRALGLEPGRPATRPQTQQNRQPERHFGGDHPKRRFVRDGEVPVVMVRGRQEHQGPAPRAESGPGPDIVLRQEREARARAERALTDAQAMVRDMQTKLAHVSLARDEARAAQLHAEHEKAAAVAELAAERTLRGEADAKAAKLEGQIQTLKQQHREQLQREQLHWEDVVREHMERAQVERAQVERAAPVVTQAPAAESPMRRKPGPKPGQAKLRREAARLAQAREEPAPRETKAAEPPRAALQGATKAVAKAVRAGRGEPKPVKWWVKAKA